MRKSIAVLVLVVAVLFSSVLPSISEVHPSIAQAYIILTSPQADYTFDKPVNDLTPADVIVFTRYRSFIAMGVDNNGVRSGTVAFYPGCDFNKGVYALSTIYVLLQQRKGAKSIPGDGHKMYRLLDTIAHNLKMTNPTSFQYNDLKVTGTKDLSSGMISVRLQLWP
jgi:hypothetical protein